MDSLGGILPENLQVRVCDLTGRELKHFMIRNAEIDIDVGDLKPGLYMISVWADSGQLYCGQLVKE